MSLLPAYFGARRRNNDDTAPQPEPDAELRDDVFRLIPPRAESFERFDTPRLEERQPEPAPAETPEIGRNVHPVAAMDLTRLSIDNDGRLYWDGKPVEVRRKLMMSRAQVVGTSLIAFLLLVAAAGAAIQGSAAAHDWACKLGWAESYCGSPAPAAPHPPARFDIPA